METIKTFIERLSVFENLYDIIRIVEPLIKKKVYYQDGGISYSQDSCYKLWNANASCENCVSIRAYNEDKTFVKIEYNKENIFMVIAAPFIIEGKKYIVEMLKDITETHIIENLQDRTTKEIEEAIKEMNHKLTRDELTGLFNRRFINERLPVDVVQSIFADKPLSVIMTDIDFFKHVNDNYGHLAGDHILTEFGALISKSIRSDIDWVARYGGEEFLIVLDNIDSDTAYAISEEIRQKTEAALFKFDQQEIKITASFGICTLENGNINADINKIINCADQNLYKAKNTGRNKSVR